VPPRARARRGSPRRLHALRAEQALARRGDRRAAAAAYERRLAEVPGDVRTRLRLAELYAGLGEPGRAADLLRALRRLPDVSAEQDVAASNRLIDLYAGPLGEPGRAMVELRPRRASGAGTPRARRPDPPLLRGLTAAAPGRRGHAAARFHPLRV
jgi:hypothetical protein